MTSVRLGTADDHPVAVAVWRASDTARRGGPAAPVVEDTVRSRLGRAGTWLTVAEEGDRVVGVAFAMTAQEDDGAGAAIPELCHLSMVFVLPDSWGQGIGGALLDATLAEARRRGYQWIQLWTHEDNRRSQHLYTGRGFQRDGRSKHDDSGASIGLWVREL